MSAPSTSGLSVELLLRVIDVKYGCFTLLCFKADTKRWKMCTRKPQLVLVSLLIGLQNGTRSFYQSLSEVMQNQGNSLITINTRLRTALISVAVKGLNPCND